MNGSSPYTVPFDLGALAGKPVEKEIGPDADMRARIAEWLEILHLDSLAAHIRLSRRGEYHYVYEAHYTADAVQACVVTLDPVKSHIEGSFNREFMVESRPAASRKGREAGNHEIGNIEEDEPEILGSQVLDLAAPVLEELSLALDPYPRAPGAAFAAVEDSPSRDSPFAALGALKLKPGPGTSEEAQTPLRRAKRPKP
jgi:uncharacterized metal-binding protein YceD (DUF177 family)